MHFILHWKIILMLMKTIKLGFGIASVAFFISAIILVCGVLLKGLFLISLIRRFMWWIVLLVLRSIGLLALTMGVLILLPVYLLVLIVDELPKLVSKCGWRKNCSGIPKKPEDKK